MKVLFWDIDGTLLQVGKAGRYAFDHAVQEIYGRRIDYSLIKTSGMTDNYIAKQIVELIENRQAKEGEIASLTSRYEELLAQYLSNHPGKILSGVEPMLTALADRADIVQLILTGNSRHGAEVKLSYHGLDSFFDFEHSAFGDGCLDRNEISAKAKQIVHDVYPNVKANEIYVIGDTPNDVRCGKAIGARTIAVAGGRFTYDELMVSTPSKVFESLPSPQEFLKALEK